MKHNNFIFIHLIFLNRFYWKTFTILKKDIFRFPWKFETLHVCLGANERYMYLCIQNEILPAEFKYIEASWKKQGSFNRQVHPYNT